MLVLLPNAPETEPAVPVEGRLLLHFGRRNLILIYLLLDSQLLIPLILLFPTDVGNTRFFILVYVENFPIHGRTLDLVRRERRVDLLLLRRLRRARAEARRRKQ